MYSGNAAKVAQGADNDLLACGNIRQFVVLGHHLNTDKNCLFELAHTFAGNAKQLTNLLQGLFAFV